MAMAPSNYATELLMLKQEISQLKTTIMMAMEQIMKAITSLHTNHCQPVSHVMDTDMENTTTTTLNAPTNHPSHQLHLPAIISELKNEIATISNETHALFQQYLPPKSTTTTTYPSAT